MALPDTQPAAPSSPARPTLGELARAYAHELARSVSPPQQRALAAIAACRTASLGGHLDECDCCGFRHPFYNSCRNRHCPQCQGLAACDWVEARQLDLLPVEYFHVVFTIPSELHTLFRLNPAATYGLLFSAAAEALLELAADPKHLGARLGLMAILHTWTQTLAFHPHLHCIIPGGGPSLDGGRWVSARPGFLLPTRALGLLLRGKLLAALDAGIADGTLDPGPGTDRRRALKRAARHRWNVYAKPSFAGPQHLLAYLGRYTHRIAISNSRLLGLEDGQVTFRYLDRADDNRTKTRTLPAATFLRHYLQHVLPDRFVRIRYYGGLSHPRRKSWLAQSRELLVAAGVPPLNLPLPPENETWQARLRRHTGVDVTRCPRCLIGTLQTIQTLLPTPKPSTTPGPAPPT